MEVQISNGNDDVEETQIDGFLTIDSTDLELGAADFFDFMSTPSTYGFYDIFDMMSGYSFLDDMSTAQKVGLRFQNIQIPQGATITSAYLEFTTDETDSQETIVTIYGEDSDDAAPFDAWGFYDLSSRPLTDASVEWNIPAWTQVGEQQQSPDIKSIVQEIVNRSGWSAGASMVFTIDGSGRRVAKSYEGEATAAPLLHITYTSTR